MVFTAVTFDSLHQWGWALFGTSLITLMICIWNQMWICIKYKQTPIIHLKSLQSNQKQAFRCFEKFGSMLQHCILETTGRSWCLALSGRYHVALVQTTYNLETGSHPNDLPCLKQIKTKRCATEFTKSHRRHLYDNSVIHIIENIWDSNHIFCFLSRVMNWLQEVLGHLSDTLLDHLESAEVASARRPSKGSAPPEAAGHEEVGSLGICCFTEVFWKLKHETSGNGEWGNVW